ncbi:hypothetical protein GQ44DRAFT_723188 [Phaeosphaeriaceae sp. PMI808]|nr:hypothetical protein GQ44DRAFT_723188 [Phaeosphaeriaceae sp. PMI808]
MTAYSQLSLAAIVGITIGTLSLCFFILVSVFVIWRRRNIDPQHAGQPEEASNHDQHTYRATPNDQSAQLQLCESLKLTCGNKIYFIAAASESGATTSENKLSDTSNLKRILHLDSASFLANLHRQSMALHASPDIAVPTTIRENLIEFEHTQTTSRISSSYVEPESGVSSINSSTNNGINPWRIEYEPNPVHFPHLATPTLSRPTVLSICPYYDSEDNTLPERLAKAREVRMADTALLPDFCVAEELHMTADLFDATVSLQAMESWSSEDTAYSMTSSTVTAIDNDVRDISSLWKIVEDEAISTRTIENVDTACFVAAIPEIDVGKKDLPNSWNTAEDNINWVVDATGYSLDYSEPSQVTSKEESTLSSTALTRKPNGSKYICPSCNLEFRTQGLRRTHQNRKHNLRFVCSICHTAFGLRADLERHKVTKHSDDFRPDTSKWMRDASKRLLS